MILVGHVIDMLRTLPSDSVHCVVTSPPYWGLRAYGTEPQVWPDGWRGELGSEPTPELFVEHIVAVFEEVRRVLRPDGTCWMNMGDCYASVGGSGQTRHWDDRGKNLETQSHRPKPPSGVKPKDLLGMPWRCAFALQAAGWYLRSDIIWSKRNPMPSSVRDRPTTAHEYVFLLTKRARYFFDMEAVKEKAASLPHSPGNKKLDSSRNDHERTCAVWGEDGRRNIRSVWSLASHSYRGAHFATYPPKLVIPCVKAGTSERGCCQACGVPWVRIVERVRRATRPGETTKVEGANSRFHVSRDPDHEREHNGKVRADGLTVGNRDPKRHVTETQTTGWRPSCECNAGDPVPCVVLDPFLGSGTTAMVAEYLGRKWIGCELNATYADMARERIAAGYQPKKRSELRPLPNQLSLF